MGEQGWQIRRDERGKVVSKPKRIQRKRTKGWRMPEGAVYVGRPTKWGNPFSPDGSWIVWAAVALGYRGDRAGRMEAAVALYAAWMKGAAVSGGPLVGDQGGGALGFADGSTSTIAEHCQGLAAGIAGMYEAPTIPERPGLEELRGKDLACFCPLDRPCHADVLLELANLPSETKQE